MKIFTEISPELIAGSPFDLIGRSWMLITAGTEGHCNMMTASWGGLGVLWNRSIATVYVRPQRYTRMFIEDNNYFTLSFFPENFKSALNLCGSKSGRDMDKAKAAGLTLRFTDTYPYYDEASLVLVCRKLYAQDFDPSCFIEKAIDKANYAAHDYHRQYIGEIVKVLQG